MLLCEQKFLPAPIFMHRLHNTSMTLCTSNTGKKKIKSKAQSFLLTLTCSFQLQVLILNYFSKSYRFQRCMWNKCWGMRPNLRKTTVCVNISLNIIKFPLIVDLWMQNNVPINFKCFITIVGLSQLYSILQQRTENQSKAHSNTKRITNK